MWFKGQLVVLFFVFTPALLADYFVVMANGERYRCKQKYTLEDGMVMLELATGGTLGFTKDKIDWSTTAHVNGDHVPEWARSLSRSLDRKKADRHPTQDALSEQRNRRKGPKMRSSTQPGRGEPVGKLEGRGSSSRNNKEEGPSMTNRVWQNIPVGAPRSGGEPPGWFWMIALVCILGVVAGMFIVLIANIGMMIEAFNTSVIWGLCWLFLPMASWVFLIAYWHHAKKYFFASLWGYTILFLSILPMFITAMVVDA